MMENNILKVSLEIFSLETVRAVISIYRKLSDIHIAFVEGNDAYLEFKNCRYGCDRTQREFMNYIINIESSKS